MKCLVLSMIPERDWNVDELICHELTRLGHNVVLRRYLPDGRDAVIIEKPDVVLMPVLRCPYSIDFAGRLKQWGIKVVARRSEAGVSREAYNKMPRQLQVNQIGRYPYGRFLDMELVWGRQFADILIAEGMVGADKIRLIGGIGLDQYLCVDYLNQVQGQSETREFFVTKHRLDPAKKIMLWCCGFKMADLNPDYNLPEAPTGDPIHRELHDRDVDGRRYWLKALQELHPRYRDTYNFFVRPHPGEECTAYVRVLAPEIRVSLDDSAADVLVHCDIMIHAGSTLAVDAHLLGKPALRFYGAADDDVTVGQVSPYCATIGELDNAIMSVVLGKSNALIKSLADLESFYGVIDGQACRRAAEAIHEFANSPIYTVIPDRWPEDELTDYSHPGAVRLLNRLVMYCSVCKKPFQILKPENQVACPHCGIATKMNQFCMRQVG